jgi:hypothetical protein
MLGILVLSGIANELRALAEVHRWTAHALVILAWTGGPIAIGSQWQQKALKQPVGCIGNTLFVLVVIAVTFMATFTGYLGPIGNPDSGADTHRRFIVLHMIVLPAILAALLGGWLRAFQKPIANRQLGSVDAAKPSSSPDASRGG